MRARDMRCEREEFVQVEPSIAEAPEEVCIGMVREIDAIRERSEDEWRGITESREAQRTKRDPPTEVWISRKIPYWTMPVFKIRGN